MPYRPSIGGLDYYKTGLSVATGDSRWLKFNQAAPQTVSGGAPIFSSGIKTTAEITNTLTTAGATYSLIQGLNGYAGLKVYDDGLTFPTKYLYFNVGDHNAFYISDTAGGMSAKTIFFSDIYGTYSQSLSIYGSLTPSYNLILSSTSSSPKGKIYLGAALTNYYDEANNAWQLGSASLAATGNLDLGGQLLVEDVTADVNFFSNVTVADAADGKSFYVYRKAAEGTSYIRQYVNQYDQAYIISDSFLTVQSAGGVVLDASTGAGSNVLIKPKVSATYFARICGNFDVGGNTMGNNWSRHYGYITAGGGEKYVQWLVNDATDKFELTRLDASILAFDVQMPLSTTDISASTINTAATQDLKLFDTGTVADDADGRALQVIRKAATEGTQTLKIGTDQFRQTYLWTNANSIFASAGSGLYDHILWRNLNSEFQIQHQALGDITLFNSDGVSIADGADGKSLWLYRKASEGTDTIRAYISAAQEASISASGVLILQSGGSGVLALRTGSSSSVLLGDTGISDVGIGSPWMYEGDKNPILAHYGYLTSPAAIKNVAFNLSSDGVYYIGRQDTTIDHMQINMPLGLNFPNGTYGEFKLQKETVDSTHILYSFSHRNNDKDLWLYAYNGSSYKNFIQFLWDSSKVDFTSSNIGTTGYATLGTIRSDYWQSAGAEVLMQNFDGLEILPGGLTGSDSALFFDQISSGKSPNIKIYNYITAVTAVKYVKLAVDDTDDYFHLSRQDTNILGFKIDMPISTSSSFNTSSDVNAGSTSAIYFGDSATDGTWKIVRSGNNLSFQRRESGAYVEKGNFVP